MELILKAEKINVEFSGKEILNIDGLEVYSYDRIGLIGDNGCGKSTLLNILTGKIKPVGCKVERLLSTTYIPQLESDNICEIADPSLLSRFGVNNTDMDTMSGGEETRRKIANAFSNQAHALFIDEPTCHLDAKGIDLLIKYIEAFDGALIVISHDRYFLDKVVDKIWELKDGQITEYWGGYSEYYNQKQEQIKQLEAEYKKVSQERERLQAAIIEKQKQAREIEKKDKGMARKNASESGGRLSHQKSTGTKQKKLHNAAKNLENRISALDEVSLPDKKRTIKFRQSQAVELHNKCPISGVGISLGYGSNVLLDKASISIPLGAKIALVGNNGCGKTSLLKMIYNRNDAFSISPKAVMGYLKQTGYKLKSNQSILSFVGEDCDYQLHEVRAVLASMGFGSRDIDKKLSVLSGGEIIKILLTKILLGRFNILLLDEPSNYLDIDSIHALEDMMKNYAGTIVFVSHDKKLVENVADIVYEMNNGTITKVLDNYNY